jgi:hypothetical protein
MSLYSTYAGMAIMNGERICATQPPEEKEEEPTNDGQTADALSRRAGTQAI